MLTVLQDEGTHVSGLCRYPYESLNLAEARCSLSDLDQSSLTPSVITQAVNKHLSGCQHQTISGLITGRYNIA